MRPDSAVTLPLLQNSGCERCVWTQYVEALEEHRARVAARESARGEGEVPVSQPAAAPAPATRTVDVVTIGTNECDVTA